MMDTKQDKKTDTGSISDGHHTFDELYEYRMLYNAHAAHGWLAAGIPVVKSWHHSDGARCFGGGRFIVVAELPTGQISNHYREECWDLFKVPVVMTPPEYDGHTPELAAQRLKEALTTPASAEPVSTKIRYITDRLVPKRSKSTENRFNDLLTRADLATECLCSTRNYPECSTHGDGDARLIRELADALKSLIKR